MSKDPNLLISTFIKKTQELGYHVVTILGFEITESLKDKDYKTALNLLKEKGVFIFLFRNPIV